MFQSFLILTITVTCWTAWDQAPKWKISLFDSNSPRRLMDRAKRNTLTDPQSMTSAKDSSYCVAKVTSEIDGQNVGNGRQIVESSRPQIE